MHKLIIAVTILFAALPAGAHEFTAGSLYIDHPMIQEAPPGAPVLGGYVSIRNDGAEEDRLVSIESAAVTKVELHRTEVTDGIARMRPMDGGMPIPPGKTVWLGEEGTHAMFINPTQRYQEGDKLPATLIFEKTGRIDVVFNVEKRSRAEMEAGHGEHGVGNGGQ